LLNKLVLPLKESFLMPHEVIMPALGMAQDMGLIVAWHKQPGDSVVAGDILMEVETDKATMEVEAGADGFVTELRVAAGEDVPVGNIVAVISENKDDVIEHVSSSTVQRPVTAAPEEPAKHESAKPTIPASKPVLQAGPANGRILASPKARRLANEQGLDLARLVSVGHRQPFHVADLEVLKALPQPGAATASSNRIKARVPMAGFKAFCPWLEGETGKPVDQAAIWAAFSAASLRATLTQSAPLVVAAEAPTNGKGRFYTDPDLSGLSDIAPIEAAVNPALILRDLSDTYITSITSGTANTPILTLACKGENYTISLEWAPAVLPSEAAISLITGFAERLNEPLRHLL
jgi:pyruvate/2-oxoglutarate dehydrogenase complex dihydrolipoamide acyltransferase (E2) component